MEIQDDINDTVLDVEAYLKGCVPLPIERKKQEHDDCRHKQVTVDEEAHSVTCGKCNKEIDPFWYLTLLANEWKSRQYRDVEYIKAYRALKQQELNSQAKGKIVIRPEQEGTARNCWDAFIQWKQQEPEYMFRRGNEWYVSCLEEFPSTEGKQYQQSVTYGFSYIKMMLAGKKL